MIGSGCPIVDPLRAEPARKPSGYRPQERLAPAIAGRTYRAGSIDPRQFGRSANSEGLIGCCTPARPQRDMFDLPGARADRQLLHRCAAIGPPDAQLRGGRCITVKGEEKLPVRAERNRLTIKG